MGDVNTSTTLAHAIKRPRAFDGRSPDEFREWCRRLAVVIGVSRRDIANLIKGHPRSTEATPGTGASPALPGAQASQIAPAQNTSAYERENQDLYDILFLRTEKPASILVLKHEDETGMIGDGQKALQELVAKYNKITDEVIRAQNGQARQLQHKAWRRPRLLVYGKGALEL